MAYLSSQTKKQTWLGWGARALLISSASVALSLACGGQTTESGGDGDVSTAGDGDGETASSTTDSTTNHGDGDTTTSTTDSSGDGDGDITTTSTGDGDATTTGDGDGDTATSGDGDGDGDGCVSDDDCVVAAQTDAACYTPYCSAPIVALRSDLAADPCLVEWGEDETGPVPTAECQFKGDIACPAICAQPAACTAAYCAPEGSCALRTSDKPLECDVEGKETCEVLKDMFEQAVERASSCLAGGVVESTECDEGLTVEALCGCPRAVSSEHPIDAGDALSAQVAFNA